MIPIFAPALLTAQVSQDLNLPRQKSRIYCPICVANGYSSGTSTSGQKWFLTTNSVGSALWNSEIPRLTLGVGYHGSTKALRGLASYQLVPEEKNRPGFNLGYGIQSRETGATGFSATAEINPYVYGKSVNYFAGFSVQSDDGRVRPVAGVKYSPDKVWYFGDQYDGRAHNPFVNRSFGRYSVGALWVAARTLTVTVGVSF